MLRLIFSDINNSGSGKTPILGSGNRHVLRQGRHIAGLRGAAN